MPLDGVDSHRRESSAIPNGMADGVTVLPATTGDADRWVIALDDPHAIEPERVGPKAANLAGLASAGLPTPGGFCITADAYRLQCARLGLGDALSRFGDASQPEQRRLSVEIRLKLYQEPIAPEILEPLLAFWRAQRRNGGQPGAVRSSALIEDRAGANFAGQFESFLGIPDEAEMLTAVRACWAALWTTNARRYMTSHDLNPAGTAMAVIVQPLIAARASGGGLSETAEGQMLLSATWGLGSAIAQGQVVPDRIVLSRQGFVRTIEAGRKDHRETCVHGEGTASQAVPQALVTEPCLDPGQAVSLGRLLRKAEDFLGMPVEIEWALDDAGFKLLQARPLHVAPAYVPDDIWLQHPGINGHPAGIGWGSGRAVVVNCECELTRVAPGDILITRVAGPALSHILPRVAGVVAELGGSTSHLASLARERGIPMVLGVLDATTKISRRRAGRSRRRRRHRAVDPLMRPRIYITQPIAESALARLRKVADVTMNKDLSRILDKKKLVAAVKKHDLLFSLLHDTIDRTVLKANPNLKAVTSMAITPDRIDLATATARKIPVTVIPPVVAEATADICFGLMLAVARRMVEGDRLVHRGIFPGAQSNHLAGAWVWGKTVGLVGGKGRIGQAVARRAHGFSMRVLL